MDTTGHYTVRRLNGRRDGDITRILCCHCSFDVDVQALRRLGDRSGLPKYNRARGRIVRHMHEKHRGLLSEPEVAT